MDLQQLTPYRVIEYVGAKTLQQLTPCRVIVSGSRLPSGYTEVSYLRNNEQTNVLASNSSAISTDVLPTETTGVKFTFKNLLRYNNDFNFIGCRRDGGNRFMVNCNGDSINDMWISYGYGAFSGYKIYKISQDGTFTVEFNYNNDKKFRVNGVDAKTITETFGQQENLFALFGQAYKADGTIIAYEYTLVGDISFTQGQNEIRRYVPCVRNSDNVAGYYELYTNKFVTNNYRQYPLEVGSPTGIKQLQPLTKFRIKEE